MMMVSISMSIQIINEIKPTVFTQALINKLKITLLLGVKWAPEVAQLAYTQVRIDEKKNIPAWDRITKIPPSYVARYITTYEQV